MSAFFYGGKCTDLYLHTEICDIYSILHAYTVGTDNTYFLPHLTRVMESSTLQRSRQATKDSLLSLTLMRKWACCEVDSPAKHPRSNPNPIAPSIPIFTVTAEVWLVSDLTPFELTWTFWFSLILINMWPNLQLLHGDYSESFESACTHAQPAVRLRLRIHTQHTHQPPLYHQASQRILGSTV